MGVGVQVPPRTPVLRPRMPFRRWVDGSGDRRRQPPDHPTAENHKELVPGSRVGHCRDPGQNHGPDDRASDAVARIAVAMPSHLVDPLNSVLAQGYPARCDDPSGKTFRKLATARRLGGSSQPEVPPSNPPSGCLRRTLTRRFRDRHDAGRVLAEELTAYRGKSGLLVLGLARGGVPVGWEVASALHADLDVFLV